MMIIDSGLLFWPTCIQRSAIQYERCSQTLLMWPVYEVAQKYPTGQNEISRHPW